MHTHTHTHTHTHRISDLSKSLRKAAPLVAEKFQFGVEAQFAVMLFAVVFLFYLTWTAILVSPSTFLTVASCNVTCWLVNSVNGCAGVHVYYNYVGITTGNFSRTSLKNMLKRNGKKSRNKNHNFNIKFMP